MTCQNDRKVANLPEEILRMNEKLSKKFSNYHKAYRDLIRIG